MTQGIQGQGRLFVRQCTATNHDRRRCTLDAGHEGDHYEPGCDFGWVPGDPVIEMEQRPRLALWPFPHIELTDSGSPIVAGSRVPVRRLFSWHKKGVPIATLMQRYVALGPAKVLSALAFAYENEVYVLDDERREREALEAVKGAG